MPAAAPALLAQALFDGLERWVVPRGLRRGEGRRAASSERLRPAVLTGIPLEDVALILQGPCPPPRRPSSPRLFDGLERWVVPRGLRRGEGRRAASSERRCAPSRGLFALGRRSTGPSTGGRFDT